MRSPISTAGTARRLPVTMKSFDHGACKAVFRLTCCCLSFGLLTLMMGCNNNPQSVEHADVSGKVLFQGKPLPGGQVTFVVVKGGFASSGPIDENGNYQIKSPVGDVEISVDNRMLQQQRGKPTSTPHLKQPGAEEAKPLKGRWVNIPSSYWDPSTSGLKFTVKPGTQTHDIELSANPTPAGGASGQ
jgi:hypothetical protein